MPIYNFKQEYSRPEDGRVICLLEDGRRIYRSRLVYCNYNNIFLEDIKDKCIHHINENKTDDTPSNLELLTQQEHRKKHLNVAKGKRSKKTRKQMHFSTKQAWKIGKYKNRKPRGRTYSQEIIQDILNSTDLGESQVSIAKRLGIPRTSVQNIIYKRG